MIPFLWVLLKVRNYTPNPVWFLQLTKLLTITDSVCVCVCVWVCVCVCVCVCVSMCMATWCFSCSMSSQMSFLNLSPLVTGPAVASVVDDSPPYILWAIMTLWYLYIYMYIFKNLILLYIYTAHYYTSLLLLFIIMSWAWHRSWTIVT